MFEELKIKIQEYNEKADFDLIEKAYNLSRKAHDNNPNRMSGEKFFMHPYNVALILANLNMDEATIAAGLLHDVLEDTIVEYDELKDQFGEEIANLVDGVTKLSKVKYKTKEERQAESLRKMVIAMSKDIRVIIIKLADRLHNIKTLEYMPVSKQKEKAVETMEIYAPIASRLGMASIKWELEDLSLQYIDPEGYKDISNRIDAKIKAKKDFINGIIEKLNEKIQEANIEGEITGRRKSIYSIYKKMYVKHKEFDEIYDISAIRAIVEDVKDCYGVLGIAHTLWKPMPGRFKDYIAMPKPNMYQSLHTTVIGPDGNPFEIQIRTYEMHRTAEYGIAAHWKYKEGIKKDDFEEKLNWLRQMLDWQQETKDPKEFMESLKIDLYTDEVFVFTPKGDVVNLPKGSTPIDFAYRVHSAVGNRCVGAKVNGRIVPLDYKLKNGNQLEIITSSNSNGPSRDWLKIVKSSQAKTKIKRWFKTKDKDLYIDKGKSLLEKEVKKQGYKLTALLKEEWLKEIAEKLNIKELDSLYAAIGNGSIKELQIITRLKNKYIEENDVKIDPKKLKTKMKQRSKKPTSGVIITGMDDLKVRFAKCCNPVPGDEIIGYITRGRGVSIHRIDCTNISGQETDGRLIEAEWDHSKKQKFTAEIQVEAADRPGLLKDITNIYTENDINATNLNLRVNKDKIAIMNMTFEISETKELDFLIKNFKKVKGVIDVFRHKK
ncbi:MAG: bifunctional (p)ppGpp synthetase/guanosine-3',5'-bis(diphosphate) 3'-pyrophosphohydrolase [Bacillota bacterium]|nr:bifunctional (p)ppGpp synthetase/guanosine-3',5'-bis(diphosphate) 3'-pyrophosphohydrolase [Bacillota bacterium]